MWLINTHNGLPTKNLPRIDVNNYPAVKAHLDNYYDLLAKRFDKGDTPYNLRSCIYWDDFYKQKIVWGEISDKTKFSIDEYGEYFTEATTFLMTGESSKFLLCFLNSKLSEYYFAKIGTTTGVGTVRWKKFKIETFPIPRLLIQDQSRFNEIVNEILIQKKKKKETYTLEKQIDNMIYRLFNFTDQEIAVIEGGR